jgi:hypothetical protein
MSRGTARQAKFNPSIAAAQHSSSDVNPLSVTSVTSRGVTDVHLQCGLAAARRHHARARPGRARSVTISAEDALIAALRVKCQHPEASINYVRHSNKRGDRHHPHKSDAVEA